MGGELTYNIPGNKTWYLMFLLFVCILFRPLAEEKNCVRTVNEKEGPSAPASRVLVYRVALPVPIEQQVSGETRTRFI
jgi:hypothetical protein